MNDCIDDIHDFWFGELDQQGLCDTDRNALWFSASADGDALISERFGDWLARAARGELDHWADSDRGLIALILLLDQFSRNIHRGQAEAFAQDARALALARQAIDHGRDLKLPSAHRVFLYMPLEHCEDRDTQALCVELFEALAEDTADERVHGFTRYAIAHREVIDRFGRFPHRNAILGRVSTPEELQYLETHGGF